jgi:hypothetical protein
MNKCNLFTRLACGLASLILALIYVPVMAAETAPSTTELYRIIQEMRAELDAVKKQLAEERAQHASAPAVEQQLQAQQAQIDAMANAVAKPADSGVHLGGYGEVHYNNLDADDPARNLKEIDFHRFVLYAGYDFNDRLRFHSELELNTPFPAPAPPVKSNSNRLSSNTTSARTGRSRRPDADSHRHHERDA